MFLFIYLFIIYEIVLNSYFLLRRRRQFNVRVVVLAVTIFLRHPAKNGSSLEDLSQYEVTTETVDQLNKLESSRNDSF